MHYHPTSRFASWSFLILQCCCWVNSNSSCHTWTGLPSVCVGAPECLIPLAILLTAAYFWSAFRQSSYNHLLKTQLSWYITEGYRFKTWINFFYFSFRFLLSQIDALCHLKSGSPVLNTSWEHCPGVQKGLRGDVPFQILSPEKSFLLSLFQCSCLRAVAMTDVPSVNSVLWQKVPGSVHCYQSGKIEASVIRDRRVYLYRRAWKMETSMGSPSSVPQCLELKKKKKKRICRVYFCISLE